ncbi:MAG: GntR family transcriptional regulator [Tepidisphaeraceae bacterium]
MSYKFQRLREKIRQAVESGELSGKLPGERELARRFHVNAKTLSKALTDLAAEGLLSRSIGRGTFVRGPGSSAAAPIEGAWLLVVDTNVDAQLIYHLKALNPLAQVTSDLAALRPSYLNQFNAVIDIAADTPEPFIRDLLVRNIPVVTVGREPRTFSTNAVLVDTALGASYIARNLLLGGHRRFVAVEGRNQTLIAETIRNMAPAYGSGISVDPCYPRDILAAVEHGATACVCDTIAAARETLNLLAQAQIPVPARISVAAIGCSDEFPCTGYFVGSAEKAAAVAEILRHGQTGRPTVLWLTGKLIDRGTTVQTGTLQIPDIAHEEPRAQIPRLSALTA